MIRWGVGARREEEDQQNLIGITQIWNILRSGANTRTKLVRANQYPPFWQSCRNNDIQAHLCVSTGLTYLKDIQWRIRTAWLPGGNTLYTFPVTHYAPLCQAVAVLWTICVLPNLKSVPSEYKHWKGARSIWGVLNRLSTHANTDINLRRTDMLPVKLPHGACPAKQKKTYY